MCCFRLNQMAEARSELAESREIIRGRFAVGLNAGNATYGYWFDWVSARILLREAAALIEEREKGLTQNSRGSQSEITPGGDLPVATAIQKRRI
jgi:hypothetical protein